MTNDNRDADVSDSSASLELNKETLKDLDPLSRSAHDVKGGGIVGGGQDLRHTVPPIESALPTVCTVVGPHR